MFTGWSVGDPQYAADAYPLPEQLEFVWYQHGAPLVDEGASVPIVTRTSTGGTATGAFGVDANGAAALQVTLTLSDVGSISLLDAATLPSLWDGCEERPESAYQAGEDRPASTYAGPARPASTWNAA